MNLQQLKDQDLLHDIAVGNKEPQPLEVHIKNLPKGQHEELCDAISHEISSWTDFSGLTGENTPEQKRLYVYYMLVDKHW